MRPTTSFALLPLLALALLPRPGAAQVVFDGIDVSGGFAGWESDEFRDVNGGIRIGVAPLIRFGNDWGVGVEGIWADSEIQLQDIPVFLTENAVNGVVRRYFADPNDAHVFLQARGGWTRLEGESADGPQGALNVRSQTGFTAGGELGVGFPAGRYIDVVWAGGFAWQSYSQCEAFGPRYIWLTPGDDCAAVRWSVRVGLVLGRSDG
jgi:hypothetical protein